MSPEEPKILSEKDITMARSNYFLDDRRQFIRLSYKTPLMYKVCKRSTISMLMEGYTRNISKAGLLCNIKDLIPKTSTLWLKLDMGALSLCKEIEKRCVIVQQGILGRVAWFKKLSKDSYDVGVRFITREEKTGLPPRQLLEVYTFAARKPHPFRVRLPAGRQG